MLTWRVTITSVSTASSCVTGGLDGAQTLFYELTAEGLRALRPQVSGMLAFDGSVIPEQKR